MGGGEEVEEDGDDNGASNEEITTGVTRFPVVVVLQEPPIDIDRWQAYLFLST